MWGTHFLHPANFFYVSNLENSTAQNTAPKSFKHILFRVNILRQKRNKFDPIHFFRNATVFSKSQKIIS